MLELAILRYAINTLEDNGRVGVQFKLTPFMHEFGIPRATFYRAVNQLLQTHFIVRVGRDKYIIGSALNVIVELVDGWYK